MAQAEFGTVVIGDDGGWRLGIAVDLDVAMTLIAVSSEDPDNWEVAEFFLPERVSNRGLLAFGSRFKTIVRRKRI